MLTQYPPLPYRRLKLMANGIWDEVNKAFYPFMGAYVTVVAKTGIRYFVHSSACSISISAGGGAAAKFWTVIVGGNISRISPVTAPAAAVGGNGNHAANSQVVDVLCDPNTSLTISAGGSDSQNSIIYAEIPDDHGWVVVE